ncbi:EF-hand domain-containing protein [Thermomonas sp.]
MLNATNNLTRAITAAAALAACMAVPAAFAQEAAKTSEARAGMAQDAQVPQASPPVAGTTAEPAKKSWSDLDVNANGSLSATEAAPIESLAKVFDKADANGDGELTQEEYKAWLAANAGKQQPKQGG